MNVEYADRDELLTALYEARNPLIDINNLQVQISNNEDSIKKNKSVSIIRLLFAAAISVVISLVIMMIWAAVIESIMGNDGMFFYILPLLLPIPLCVLILKKWKKKRLKTIEQLTMINQNLQEQIRNIFADCGQILYWIPNKYCNYYCVRDLIQILENYRASNFKELANVYEQDVYNQRIIQGQQEIKAQQMNIAIMNSMQQAWNTRKVTDAINYGIDYKI